MNIRLFCALFLAMCGASFGAVSGPYTVVDNGSNTKEVAPTVTIVQTLDGSGNRINLGSGSGDASAANQTAIQANAGSDATKAASIQGITGGKAVPVSGTFWQATQPVSAAALPLPTGAATDALQTTINGKLPTFNTGAGSAGAGTIRVTLPYDQSVIPVQSPGFAYTHISTATTTVCRSGFSVLEGVSINTKGVASTATIYDNTAGSGAVVAVIDTTLGTSFLPYKAQMGTGITVVTTGTADITVIAH